MYHIESKQNGPHFLVIDGDAAAAREVAATLAAAFQASSDPSPRLPSSRRGGVAIERAVEQCIIVDSLAALAQLDLKRFSLVICAMDLVDGTGIDAITYIHSANPSLPIILTSPTLKPALAVEAVRTGALDCLVSDEYFLDRLPVCVEKCLAHHRLLAETQQLQASLSEMLADMADENRQLQAMISELESIATTDELTGLNNRRRLNRMLDLQWRGCRDGEAPLAFMMIDLDGFKNLNDRLGHQQGDLLLSLTGRVLRENCRATDIVARYGGDEFCILMPGATYEEATGIARRIVDAFKEVTVAFAGSVDLSLSIGVAHTLLSRPSTSLQLVAHADQAMYAAKSARRPVMVRLDDEIAAA